MRRYVGYVLLTLLFLVLIFIVQNAETIGLRFLFWSADIHRAWVVLVILAVGALLGWFLRGLAQRMRPHLRGRAGASRAQ